MESIDNVTGYAKSSGLRDQQATTVGHGPASRAVSIVGPIMYVYFTAANSSDAGFTVDLLFKHPTYAKVRLHSIGPVSK